LVIDHPGAPEQDPRPYVVDADELRLGADDRPCTAASPTITLDSRTRTCWRSPAGDADRALSSAAESQSESFVPFLI